MRSYSCSLRGATNFFARENTLIGDLAGSLDVAEAGLITGVVSCKYTDHLGTMEGVVFGERLPLSSNQEYTLNFWRVPAVDVPSAELYFLTEFEQETFYGYRIPFSMKSNKVQRVKKKFARLSEGLFEDDSLDSLVNKVSCLSPSIIRDSLSEEFIGDIDTVYTIPEGRKTKLSLSTRK